MISVRLENGHNQPLQINDDGTIGVVVHGHPPIEPTITQIPFRQRLRNEAGSESMVVNGSVTPVDYYIKAIADRSIFINESSLATTVHRHSTNLVQFPPSLTVCRLSGVPKTWVIMLSTTESRQTWNLFESETKQQE